MDTVTQEGPRCYLEPAGNGEGMVEICLTEGKLDIGVADSDYYFTAFTGNLSRAYLQVRGRPLPREPHMLIDPASAMRSVRTATEARGVRKERRSRDDGG